MQAPPRKGLAVTSPGSHLRFWTVAALATAADLASKALLWRYLGGPPDEGGRGVEVLPGWFRLVASRNPGVVFGIDLGRWLGLGRGAGLGLSVGLTVLTAGLVFYLFAVSDPARRLPAWGGALVLAGAAGNLYDRLLYGHVRDLFLFTVTVGGRPVWPFVFNAADAFLVLGVALLVVEGLRSPCPVEGEPRPGRTGPEPCGGQPARPPASARRGTDRDPR